MKDKNYVIKKLTNAMNANDMVSAKSIIESELKNTVPDYEYYFYLALVTDDLTEKKAIYTKAIDANPQFMDAYINRGLVNNELQDYEASVKDYNKAIELDSKCALAYNNRGYTKYKMQNFKEALNDYNKAILLNPKLQIAIDNKAKLLLEVCLEDDANFSEKYYLSLGISEINLGNIQEAIVNFDEALKFNPNSALVHFYKGVAYHTSGDDSKAIESYTTAIKNNKNMIDAYFNRGQLLFNDNPKLALDDFVTAVALDDKFIDAYYSIASVQKKLGQYSEAIKNLDKILLIEPNAVNAKALKKLIQNKYL